jgi:hypothetical protein
MQEENLDRLLRKYLTRTISEPEMHLLQKWLNQDEFNLTLLKNLEKTWEEKFAEPQNQVPNSLIEEIWQEGVARETYRKKYQRPDYNYYLKLAASFFIFISLIFYMYSEFRNQPVLPEITTSEIFKENPAGQKSKITLPDGSIVWLNGASSLKYNSDFNDSLRQVSLEGEAYFEVAHNPAVPFLVETGNLVTTALGTAFNVEAYSSEKDVKVSLLQGKVRVEPGNFRQDSIILSPGYQAVYHKNDQSITGNSFDSESVVGWKDGKLVFRKAEYAEVMAKLERWYGIKIITEGSPEKAWRLSTVYQDEVLVNILKNLRFGKEFQYELKKNELIIRFNR